jgi:hypothetical protein
MVVILQSQDCGEVKTSSTLSGDILQTSSPPH